MTKYRQLAYLALLLNCLIWGAAFAVVKPVFGYITPLGYLYLRFLVAGLLALPIFFYYYLKIHPKTSYLIKSLLLEITGTALPLLILYEGLAKTSALEASLIGATGPIFIVLGGIIFLHERQERREWQGLALSLLGSLLIIFEPIWNGHGLTGSSLTGNLYILGYNLIYAFYAIFAKKVYRRKPPLYLGALTYLTTALIYAIILSYTHTLPSLSILLANSRVLAPVLYMAIPGGILAFALNLYAISRIEVSEASLFTYLNGVVAIPAAYFLLGEKPSWLTLLAILLISYGVFRAELRKK